MPLYVRDDEVHEMANRLAQRRQCNVTEAVRAALREALDREEADIAARKAAILKIVERVNEKPQLRPGFTDKDLYDENGLPIY